MICTARLIRALDTLRIRRELSFEQRTGEKQKRTLNGKLNGGLTAHSTGARIDRLSCARLNCLFS
jgi:hypothetical protein